MRFQTGQSWLHRLHPLVKLAWLLWITAAVFIFDAVALPLIAAGAALVLLWWSGTAPWRMPGLRLWLVLAIVILLAQAALVRTGEPLLGPLTTGGLAAGLRALGRLLAVVLLSAAFVTTTEPVTLADALMRVGLPYRWGFALVTALRLAPVFRLEAHHVYRAQLVRGVAYDAGGPRKWWLLLRNLCLPLVICALRSAQALSLSMEGRAFGLHPRRTQTRQVRAGWRELVATALWIASVIMAIGYGLARRETG